MTAVPSAAEPLMTRATRPSALARAIFIADGASEAPVGRVGESVAVISPDAGGLCRPARSSSRATLLMAHRTGPPAAKSTCARPWRSGANAVYARPMPLPAQAQDVAAAVLGSTDEQELALSQRREGRNVVAHGGRYWMEAPRGFFQATHWLARFRADEVTAPRSLAWGYRAALRDGTVSPTQTARSRFIFCPTSPATRTRRCLTA